MLVGFPSLPRQGIFPLLLIVTAAFDKKPRLTSIEEKVNGRL